MKKNHTDIVRKKTVAMVPTAFMCMYVFECVFLPCVWLMQTEYVITRVNTSSLCDCTWQSGKSEDKNSLLTKRCLQHSTLI